MSLKPLPILPIRSAKSFVLLMLSFPVEMCSCRYVMLWERFTRMRHSPTFFRPVVNPLSLSFRLALVTIFQFMEGLTDRQAADAVRDRLAWKYADHAWNFAMLALIIRFFPNFVLAWSRARLNNVCWMCALRAVS